MRVSDKDKLVLLWKVTWGFKLTDKQAKDMRYLKKKKDKELMKILKNKS